MSSRWTINTAVKAAGSMATWKPKKRVNVAAPTSSPPRSSRATPGPTTGSSAAMSVPTLVAKNASSFHGSR